MHVHGPLSAKSWKKYNLSKKNNDVPSNIVDNNTPHVSGDLMQLVMVKVDAQIVD